VEQRPFGQTGLEVSAVGFGCWEIGGGYGSIEVQDFNAAVSRALDLGINCFDTAEGYGMGASERALGEALGARRSEAVIVSKFGMNYRDKPNLRDSSRERVFASIDKTLKNLGTDYLDVYLVHWPDRLTPFEETMTALDEVVKDGKVRFVGLSNFKREEIEACMQVRRVDVVQYGWHMFDRRMQREILPFCADNGIGFMAYGSLGYGLLSGSLTPDSTFAKDDWRARAAGGGLAGMRLFDALFGADAFPRNLAIIEEMKAFAAKRGKSLPQLALRWATAHPTVSTSLVGCRNVAEVEDNAGAIGWSLSDEDVAELDGIFAKHDVDPVPDYWIEDA
jgi:aryl-alcohol dehydrogenase-like predicted oxidoreductase